MSPRYPELLRKGASTKSSLTSPDKVEREDIFSIHLRKRKRDPAKFKLGELASKTDGFSGAEIEQVVVGGLLAFDADREIKQSDLIKEAEPACRSVS